MKRKERRHLKSNEFAEFIQKALHFFKMHTREFAAGAAVLAVVVLMILGVRYIKARTLEKQSRILAEINQLSRQMRDDPLKLEELEALAGPGKFARAANIHIAAYQIENGEYDKALEAVNSMPSGPKDILFYQSRELKALVLLKQEKYTEALEVFETIEAENPEYYVMDGVLFKKAEVLKKMGRAEEAIEVYKRITEKYSGTYYAMEAQQELTNLQAE
jgi:tetratricopeptide (TPR) repeat protein